MNKFEFKLKQHTPLIHFQHDQAGATLRASEVKPKLDTFLIEKLLKDQSIDYNYYDELENGSDRYVNSREAFFRQSINPETQDQKKWLNWLIGKGSNNHVALNYKVQIISKDQAPYRLPNVRLISDADKTAIVSHDIYLCIKSFEKELVELIKKSINEFFCLYNFGNRQNKCWGGFTTEHITNTNEFENILKLSGKDVFKLNINQDSFNQDIYNTLLNKWRLLKSGNNYPYMKSMLFQYMCLVKNIRWEKRAIKKAINSDRTNFPNRLLYTHKPIDCTDNLENEYNEWQDNPEIDYPYRFVRLLLGLPEHYEFRTENPNFLYQVTFNSENEVKRFKAPVTFKWFNRTIYAIAEEIPDYLLSERFFFYVQIKERVGNKWIVRGKPINIINNGLQTPQSFNLNYFLKEYLTRVGFVILN